MDELKKVSYLENEYLETLKEIVSILKQEFKENLLSIVLGGSGGKKEIIPGWSDLDLYVILRKMDLYKVGFILNKLKDFKIHIGLTYYTEAEIRKNIIDSKTKIMIYEKRTLNVNPTIYGEDLLGNISYKEVVFNDKENLPNILHVLRRMTCSCINDINNLNKKYVKKLFVLLKCYLNINEIFVYGYENTLKKFLEVYNRKTNEKLDFDIKKSINEFDQSKELILDFSLKILEYIDSELEELK